MSQYFAESKTGNRYAAYRPKVHHVVLEWLEQHLPRKRFDRAVDVACGTGDSTMPLHKIADEVLGIDSSDEMLAVAKDRGLTVQKADYSELPQHGRFDLISTCMAFHWFEAETAIESYKSASNKDAVWLIYNFSFGGHSTSDEFNHWFYDWYLKTYPSPPRGKVSDVGPAADPEVQLLGSDTGSIPLEFTNEELFGYLSTQSNLIHQIQQGEQIEKIRETIMNQLTQIETAGTFKYVYTYEILQFKGSH